MLNKILNNKFKNKSKKENDIMNKQELRMEKLQQAGVDTTKYFTVKVNEDIPKGSTIKIICEPEVVYTDDEIRNEILNSGYIKVENEFRRWVMAQYLKMINYVNGGYHGYLNNEVSYTYTITTTIKEIRTLYKLEKVNYREFAKRSQFFTVERCKDILIDYAKKLTEYVKSVYGIRVVKNAYEGNNTNLFNLNYFENVGEYSIMEKEGITYYENESHTSYPIRRTKILFMRDGEFNKNYYADYFYELFESYCEILNCIRKIVDSDNLTYGRMNTLLPTCLIPLPKGTKKSNDWVESYKRNGVYYTLENMIKYHKIKFYEENDNDLEDIDLLNYYTFNKEIETYKLHAKLLELLDKNNFSLRESIKENFGK